ncbi:MAG: class II fumarate hydratase [Candidatus Omnitrophota bacterium]|nr:class II fumarate hydratase [Candidatus Omnitrophota bacterium]
MSKRYRIVKDSMGEVRVPADALYGAQTQRAVENFQVSGHRFPRSFIHVLGHIKAAAANANRRLKLLDPRVAAAIHDAAIAVGHGKHDDQFPLDIFQTGSGTSTNMNANEVIATLATRKLGGRKVHPNDHVNMSQSSNDVIPAAIHVAAALEVSRELIPALKYLAAAIRRKAHKLDKVVVTGRTHLMDAMPLRLSQEMGGWAMQIEKGIERVEGTLPRLAEVALGGTAVGTGINAHPRFGRVAAQELAKRTKFPFRPARDYFEALSSQDTAVELSGQLAVIAASCLKITSDLRWMNSGPYAGLGEIRLPALQPGSSIMPGKVNPVIPESMAMVCVHVIGNDTAIKVSGGQGNFQLNVMLPVIAYNLLQSIELLAKASRLLADKAIAGFTVNTARINEAMGKNPILVTALNPVVGYEMGAKIAKKAYAEGRPLIDVAVELTGLSRAKLQKALNPAKLTRGGVQK